MINAQLTKDLRLTADDRDYIVEERFTVDPSRAPGYKAPADGSVPVLREDWRAIAWFGQRASSIPQAVEFAVMRTVARSDVDGLTGLVALIREEFRRVTDAVNAAIRPPEISARPIVVVGD